MFRLAWLIVPTCAAFAWGCSCNHPASCRTDFDCRDDGLFCTLPSHCLGNVCVSGGSPCGPRESCDEGSHACHAVDDAGPIDGSICADIAPGNACDGFCASSSCQSELQTEYPVSVRLDGTSGRSLPMEMFPAGYCAARCDATRLNDECAPCGSCNGEMLAGRTRLPLYYVGQLAGTTTFSDTDGVCRERCAPSTTGTGCSRTGYTCDLETSTCMEACTDDRQCQLLWMDRDGDGTVELVDRGESYPAFCDHTTGRCHTTGTPGAHIGDRCTDDAECPSDGACLLTGGQGICTRLGCRAAGFECESGSVCDLRNAGYEESGCFVPCQVGAEDGTAAMLGSSGGNPSCGAGLACMWNGVAAMGDPLAGSCVLGAYNDRTEPNIGAPCHSAADCYSPFGYGVCLFVEESAMVGTGICSVQSCSTFAGPGGASVDGLLPGVAITAPICDSSRGEVCMNLDSQRFAPLTYCMERCTDATSCAPGYACAELLGGGGRFCWPRCYDVSDCRAGASCQSPSTGAACGPSDTLCYCSDRSGA